MIDEDALLSRRGLLTKGLVAGTATLGVGNALRANSSSRLPLDVSVANTADPLRIQRVAQFDVEVVNNGSEPVNPSFSVLRESRQTRFYWNVTTEGGRTVEPGETKRYRLHTTTPGAAIPYDETYVVIVEDEDGSRGVTVENHTETDPTLIPVRDSSIDSWFAPLDKGVWTPFRWAVSTWDEGGGSAAVVESDRGGRFNVTGGSRSDSWTMAGVTQDVPFLDSLEMEATPGSLTTPSTFQSDAVCGLEVIDRNHRIWAVYADVSERQQRYYPGELDYHVEYIPASRGQQTRFDLDLGRIYDLRDWDQSPAQQITIDGVQYQATTMTLHPFAAVYNGEDSTTMELSSVKQSVTYE